MDTKCGYLLAFNPNANNVVIDQHGDNSGNYVNAMRRIITEIRRLLKEGHEVKWNSNNCFCTIAGRTFNIHKSVYKVYFK